MSDVGYREGPTYKWWQEGIVYEVYPRSFQDSNGDGIGDLPGLIERLDYLEWLGVSAVWLCPVYASPMADFGYDVADHTAIDAMFGTLRDFDLLVASLHRRRIKLIMDFVPNHTSECHPWFVDALTGRNAQHRDWYIWRDARPDGGPPTNWQSEFGGPAWTFDERSGQYYYHAYLPAQPDLNWRNKRVQCAMQDVMRFWLDRGVDGFRVDAIHMLFETETLEDNPPNPAWHSRMPPSRKLIRVHTADRPETLDMVTVMRRTLDEYDDRVLIGEAYLPIDRLMAYYGESLSGFHLPFNFHLLSTPWDPLMIAELVQEYEEALPSGGWPNWVLGNHDRSRIASRLGTSSAARLAAMLLLTIRGTPTIYYGDELGMRDVEIPEEHIRDPWERRVPGLGLGRDPARTPMRWTSEANAGFTTGVPWLPIGNDVASVNVAAQREDATSMLCLHRALILLRWRNPALRIGSYREVARSASMLAYVREHEQRSILVVLNFSAKSLAVDLAELDGHVLLSTHTGRRDERLRAHTTLRANEGVVVALSPARA